MDDNELKIPGMICKSASISAGEVTERQLAKINKYTLEPLTAEQVFAFKAVLCDNMVDRDFEKFSGKALDDLRRLFVGKTVIKDHRHTADSQIARIFDTELEDSGEMLPDGEAYKQLVAHCYMVRTESNKDLIAEIIGGIRKEGSVSCSVNRCVCSVCGADNRKAYCQHWRGRKYDGKECYFTLDGAKDAYEFSLVAVPSQKAAGISKSYTGETVYEKDHPQEAEDGAPADTAAGAPAAAPAEDTSKAMELMLRARLSAVRARNKED